MTFMWLQHLQMVKSAALNGDDLYFMPGFLQSLYKLNLKTWQRELLYTADFDKNCYAFDTYLVNGKIYCVPIKNVMMSIYDTKLRQCIAEYYKGVDSEIIDTMLYEDKIWSVPRNMEDKMFYFSISERGYREDNNWQKSVREVKATGRIERVYKYGQCLYMSFGKEERVLCYDFAESVMSEVPLPKMNFYDAVKIGNVFYAIEKENNGRILCWNQVTGETKTICGEGEDNYIKLTVLNDVILLDRNSKLELLHDNKITILPLQCDEEIGASNYYGLQRLSNGHILLLPWGRDKFVIMSENGSILEETDVKTSVADILRIYKIISDEYLLLDEYLQFVADS